MAGDSDQDKTLPATPKRLEEVREEGRAPRSPELAGTLVLMFIAGAVWLGGPAWLAQWRQFVRAGLHIGQREAMDVAFPTLRLAQLAWEAVILFAPVAAIAAVAAIGGTLAVGGWLFSPNALQFKFDRMSPISYVGRVFSLGGLGELAKTLLKALLIGAAGAWTAWHFKDASASLAVSALPEALRATGNMLLMALFALVLAMVVIASLDVPFQLWRFYSGLRMSEEEVRREHKEAEGNPQVKGRIRQQQREMAKRRMMQEVPKADVIVTNPTHYAVALVYDEGKMRAPRIVAMGVDEVAFVIRELGARHNVPLLEAPPLARALYAHGEIDQEIPAALYSAVAQVLAWVFQLRLHRQGEGDMPQAPTALEVPASLDPAVTGATA